MDIQAIIARVEAIAASGIAEVEKVIHEALDTVEQVLGLDDSGEVDATGDAGNVAPAADGSVSADASNSATTAPSGDTPAA